ncbi:hypothetical protein HYFRA_00000026 [Hymenoscyphus fraxineus]|uniref:2EXR domain-containing protein n=1 Tax=Hymenoscyphus fraxineus TaxID=746836 RepID=A0A9N9L330_9HELO|nr:hypothetical protein HYFRA_00000026 [Hymenoscyphus fraxineus]
MGRRWIRNKVKELKGPGQYLRKQKKKKARARRLNDLEGRFRVEKKEYTTGPRKSANEDPNRTSPGVVISAIESLTTELELAEISPTTPRSPAHKEPEVIKKDCLKKAEKSKKPTSGDVGGKYLARFFEIKDSCDLSAPPSQPPKEALEAKNIGCQKKKTPAKLGAFNKFCKLPLELQIMVWNFAIDNLPARAINVLARGGDYFLVGGHTIPFSLGVVCKDSRWAYNKRLTKIPVSSRGMNNPFSNLRYIKVDLEKDVLLFSHNTSAFVHLLPDAITANIKYVGKWSGWSHGLFFYRFAFENFPEMKAAVCVDGEKEEDTSTVGTEGDCSALLPMTSRPNHHLSWYIRHDDAVSQIEEGWKFHLDSPFSDGLGPEAVARGCPPCLRMIMKRCY